ncbi:MAG: GntR family transcriptional regulator [Lentisphaeria bacterium]|nr:GntR family transcriptional regulator [Lentisphaeria bacterium]
MRKPDKAFAMINYLEDQLLAGAYTAGQRMPSLRALMRKFQVSYGTARRGMGWLYERYPDISRETGRGTYFTPAAKSGAENGGRTIAVCRGERSIAPSGLYVSALNGIISAAKKESVNIEVIPPKPELRDAGSLRELTSHFSGVILLGQYDALFPRLEFSVPAVGVMMENSFDGQVSVVDLDPYLSAKIAVRYFLDRGLRRVKILSSMNNAFVLRGKIFAMLAAEQGIRCSKPVAEVRSYAPDTGYFFTSDNWAHSACLRYRERTGRDLTADHVIMGVDGKQLLLPNFSRFPTVAVDWEQVGIAAFNECLARINNPALAAKKIFLTGWFVNYPE